MLRASDLNWTIMHAVRLTNGPATGTATVVPEDTTLIVGAGPAGTIAFAQLAEFPGITTRLIERRPHRLELGQADGIQARTVETFQAFGFADRLLEESYRIYSMAFWKPDATDPTHIARSALLPDDPSGISEFPHVILNQARVQDYFLEAAANSPTRATPDYGIEFLALEVTDADDHPVKVEIRHTSGPRAGERRTIHAQYVVGCDGARSNVREAIGRGLTGQAAMHA